MELIYEKSKPGRRASTLPSYDLPAAEVPEELRRAEPPRLPELAEPEVVRHFTELSTRNFGIDTGFYPLGSCTMKHNPRVNERVVMLPGFKDLHPHQDEDGAQGALELMWRLQEILQEVAGLDACSLQPAAGSQGELTGLMLMRAYFEDIGEGDQRDTIITADTAHGTNPASVTMAGYKLEKVATDARGNLDVDDLRAKVNERTAGLMLTNPSTLGLFDEHIEEVAKIFHDAGSLLYYDGANLNAVCGISRPGDMGFDIVHINLHKTFSQPHGGGGPGGGPIVVRDKLEPFLPVPAVVKDGDAFRLDHDRPKSIGKVRGFTGPFGVFVRSYAYIRSYGPALREMSEVAVLNANYLLARLRDAYDLPYDRLCMHEFVLSARTLKREHGVTALDVAKRLMDYGYHPPTIYFPLVVPEALMIEPTETEPKERLDAFVDAMLAIAREAAEDPDAPPRRAALAAGAPPRRGEGREARHRQVRLRRAPGPLRRGGRGPAARGARGRMTGRAEIARRVDELAEEHSGRDFAEAIRSYSETLDEQAQEQLKQIAARAGGRLRPGDHGTRRRARLVPAAVGQGRATVAARPMSFRAKRGLSYTTPEPVLHHAATNRKGRLTRMERLAYYVAHHRRLVIGVWILLTAFGAFLRRPGRRPLARGLLDSGCARLRSRPARPRGARQRRALPARARLPRRRGRDEGAGRRDRDREGGRSEPGLSRQLVLQHR